MIKPVAIITALFLIPLLIFSGEPQIKNYQVVYPEHSAPIAVCMLIHGLNLKPSRMQWIRNELLKQGAIVVSVELWGHGNNPIVVSDSSQLEERLSLLKEVTWTQWMNDTKPALQLIDRICEEQGLPKYFVGFSLGGLVGASLGSTFDKYLLLAPAIKIKPGLKASIGMMSTCSDKVIKSKSPLGYRDNRGTPVAAYKALLTGVKRFEKVQTHLKNCLIIVDKNDELVSARKLQKYADKNGYAIILLNKRKTDCDYCSINHLIIDEESLGSYSSIVSRAIQSFLNEDIQLQLPGDHEIIVN